MKSYFNNLGYSSYDTWVTKVEDRDSYDLRYISGKSTGVHSTYGISATTHLCDNSFQMADINGKLYRITDLPEKGVNGPVICVDTNGQKGPNRYGYDYFAFIFTIDGKVIPMGTSDSNNTTVTRTTINFFLSGSKYCDKTNTANDAMYGSTCAHYALLNKSPVNSNKSYWKDFL